MVGERLKNRTVLCEQMARAFVRRQPAAAEDRRRQEAIVRASEFDWTIIKPARLTDGRRTGRVQIGTELRAGVLSKISRSELAEVIVEEIDHPRHVREAISVLG
jgi:putative NADH-flavin reductase